MMGEGGSALRRDQLHLGEVGPDPGGVVGEKDEPSRLGVRADEEIGQRKGAGTAGAAIARECLGHQPGAGPRQRQPSDASPLECAFEAFGGGDAD